MSGDESRDEDALDVVVSGGSMGGLAAAIALREHGHRVGVYERSTGERAERGAGIVAQPTVLDFFADRGLGPDGGDPDAFTTSTPRRQYLDADGGVERERPESMRFTSWDAVFRRLRAGFPDARYHRGYETVGVDPGGSDPASDRPTATFDDGGTADGDVVVAAEGLRSTTRAELFPEATPEYAGYVAWRGVVPESAAPDRVREQFTGAFTFYEARDHLILGYPIPGEDGSVEPGERRLNWVWYDSLAGELDRGGALTDNTGEERAGAVPPGRLPDEVWESKRADAADFPAVFESLVARTDDPFVQSIYDLAVPSMVEGNVCLLGDAAFVARPHTAAGTSKAVGDGAALGDAVASHSSVDTALSDWEADRLPYGRRLVERGREMGDSYMEE